MYVHLYSEGARQDELRRHFWIDRDLVGNVPGLDAIFPNHPAPVIRLHEGKNECGAGGRNRTGTSEETGF